MLTAPTCPVQENAWASWPFIEGGGRGVAKNGNIFRPPISMTTHRPSVATEVFPACYHPTPPAMKAVTCHGVTPGVRGGTTTRHAPAQHVKHQSFDYFGVQPASHVYPVTHILLWPCTGDAEKYFW